MNFNEAEAFENNSTNQREDGLNLSKLLSLNRGNNILDIGCATGYLTKVLADQVGPEGKVVGIDPDLERLQLARKKYPAANIQYLEGRAEDADSIPGRDYDVVFSNYVLQCIKDKERVFHNVNKCLKVGGKFGFVSFLYANYFEGRSVFTPPEAFSPEFLECRREDMTPFTVEEYRRIASAHHFDIVIMKEDVREWEFKDIEELIEVHMTHAQGRFDRTHFNTSLLQQHFEGRKISFELPHVTVVLRKLQ